MKRLTSIFMVLAMLLTLAPINILAANAETTVFSDMKTTDYYAQAATALEQLDILAGYPDGTFGAEKSITRAEMAAIVCRMIDKQEDSEKAKGETAFDDVKSDHWASGYINIASKEGIINGDGNGKFRPEDDVKHEEAIKMVVCALGYGDDVKVDAKDWSKGYLEVADEKGISADLKGTKGKAATRGDVAVMCYNGLATDAENAKIPATPVASKEDGEYKGTQKVKLTTTTKDADIYYTTDGTTPTVKSTKYTKEISISKTSTLKAIAVKNGVVSKDVMSVEYTIKKVSSGGGGGVSSTYTVTFNLNYEDALDTPNAQKIKSGNKVAEPIEPVRDGYHFIGWSTSNDEEKLFNFDSNITKSITLYALWEEKSEAERYYESTSEIVDVIDVEESTDVLTEAEVNNLMQNSGFADYPVTYEYNMTGEYGDKNTALEDSSNKHPMYQTYYLSEAGEGWVLYIVNGEVFANPISFNLESDLGVLLLISTSETLTSYDEITNKFFVNIPYESAIVVKTVENINAETLDSLTIEELCRLSGAAVSTPDTEDESVSENIALLSYDDSISTLNAINQDGDPVIVVSLGDSYSSGEGIEPFYGQDKALSEKVNDEDWLAHRSTKSWPSLLEVPGVAGTMANYKTKLNTTSTANYQWYFVASSGAETQHFKTNSQEKKYDRDVDGWFNDDIEGVKYLPPQLTAFNTINGDVDFVTLTIGGNDVGFTDIVTTCATNCANIHWGSTSKLEDTFTNLWNNFSTTETNLKQTYNDIAEKAGTQAEIIVAGYPKLLDKEGKGAVINKTEAQLVNKNVSKFNDKIEEIVNACKSTGMNIHFVDVEDEFDGHEAYSNTPWINKIMIGAQAQELDDEWEIASAYSIHPNASGARAYARCVNAKIEEIVGNNKDKKKISGVITIADTDTDMTNNIPLEGAEVVIEISSYMDGFAFSNERGEYTLTNIPHGTFTITVSKEGYIPVTETIVVGQHDTEIIYNITIEAIPEAYEGVGYASGTIYDVRTGTPISGLTLYIREGLGNTTGDTVGTLYMNDSSVYSTTLGLPAGNYTIQVVDERTGISDEERYITSSFNIKILGGMTINNQNGYVSNSVEIEELRIVLTWGATPSDLDSHLVGPTANGGKFHVFYSDKTYGSEANLDVDDTSSYGPETVTIHSFNEGTYTYAIHDYSNRSSSYSISMANSGAQVKVYRGAELLATYNVPANMDGTLWTVFTYDSSTKRITPVNTMTYDSSSGGSLMSLASFDEDTSNTINLDDITSIIEQDISSHIK